METKQKRSASWKSEEQLETGGKIKYKSGHEWTAAISAIWIRQ